MSFDPGSFGAGFGAGQAKARNDSSATDLAIARAGEGAAAAGLAAAEGRRISAESSRIAGIAIERMEKAEGDIKNRWIPYAVTLRASLLARKVERDVLIDELRRLDPANADQIAKNADEARLTEYDKIESATARKMVLEESEAERIDK